MRFYVGTLCGLRDCYTVQSILINRAWVILVLEVEVINSLPIHYVIHLIIYCALDYLSTKYLLVLSFRSLANQKVGYEYLS